MSIFLIHTYKFGLAAFLLLLNFFAKPLPESAPDDSLSLNNLLHEVIEKNPDVLRAQQTLIQTDEQIQIIRSSLKPFVDVSASYTRIDPINTFNLPGLGSHELNPANNYDVNISYRQTLYDFGKTNRSTALENERKKLLNESIEQLRQELSIKLINTYFHIVYIKDALRINDEEMKNLQEHLNTVKKKLESGTSTKYALLSTEVRISKLKTRRVDLEFVQSNELSVLSTLVGRTFGNSDLFRVDVPSLFVSTDMDEVLDMAYQTRSSIKIAHEREKLSELQMNVIRVQNNPNVFAIATLGWKNGFQPDIEELRTNYAVGIGVKIPIYTASQNKHQFLLEKSKLHAFQYATELEKRAINHDVVVAIENVKANSLKVSQVQMQVQQAEEAYKLAEISFEAGALTNLDLLDASTNLQQSKLDLLKAQIDYQLAAYQVKLASGEKLYQL